MKLKSLVLALPLALVLMSAQLGRKEKITIFNVKLKAVDISGTNVFREPVDRYWTTIQPNLTAIRADDIVNLVGSYRPNYSSSGTLDLFNLSAQDASYKLLDEIDMDFYKKVSFGELRDSTKYRDEFVKFVAEFDAAPTIKEKKYVIIAHPLIHKDLVKSRLDIMWKPVAFDRHKIASLTESIKADVTGLQVNGVDISPKVQQYLSKLVDESVKVSGVYYTSRLRSAYLAIIKDHIDTTPTSQYGQDGFARNLADYLNPANTRAAINTQLVAIRLKGTLTKALVTKDSIAADLQAKFKIPSDQAYSIATSASFAFSSKVTQNILNNFNDTFLIRYSTSAIADDLLAKN